MKKLFLLLFLICPAFFHLGNAQTEARGEIQDQEFIIRKDRVLSLPNQARVYEKLPSLPQPEGRSDFTYGASLFPYQTTKRPLDLEAAKKTFSKPVPTLFPGFVKLGYGNFESPLLEARYMATEPDPLIYSLGIRHQSFGKGPIWDSQSAESHSQVEAGLGYFLDQVEVFGGLSWTRDSYAFYGLDTEILNQFDIDFAGIPTNDMNTYQVHAGIRDLDKTGFLSYEGQLRYRNFSDAYLAREGEVGIQGAVKIRTNESWTAGLDLEYFHMNTEDETYDLKRDFLSVQPSVNYTHANKVFLQVGAELVYENDSLPEKTADFRVFPTIAAQVKLAEELQVFGEFRGGVERNTYWGFVQENPFLSPSSQILNTSTAYEVHAGIKGNLEQLVHYKVGGKVSRMEQMHFYINNPADSSRFQINYDAQVDVIAIYGELGLQLQEEYTLSARLDWFQYTMSQLAEAWHRPTWQLMISNQWKPLEGLLLQANVQLMGGIKSPVFEGTGLPFTVKNLPTLADLQLKADYQLTDRVGMFVEGSNLLNRHNMRWNNYPVRGTQVLGGVWLKF